MFHFELFAVATAAIAVVADKVSKLWICKECNNRFLCNPDQRSVANWPERYLATMCECVVRARAWPITDDFGLSSTFYVLKLFIRRL